MQTLPFLRGYTLELKYVVHYAKLVNFFVVRKYLSNFADNFNIETL